MADRAWSLEYYMGIISWFRLIDTCTLVIAITLDLDYMELACCLKYACYDRFEFAVIRSIPWYFDTFPSRHNLIKAFCTSTDFAITKISARCQLLSVYWFCSLRKSVTERNEGRVDDNEWMTWTFILVTCDVIYQSVGHLFIMFIIEFHKKYIQIL